MSPADIAFVVGPVGAIVVVPLAMVVLAVRRHPAWAVWLGALLALTVAISWLAYWFLWGRVFDNANAFQQVPGRLDTALGVTMGVAAFGCVGVVLAAVIAIVRSRPER
jgi:cytochrome c biogenesis protein CcdA